MTRLAMRASPLFIAFPLLTRGLLLVSGAACPARQASWADALLPAGDGVVNAQPAEPSLRRERSSRNRAVRLVTSTNAIRTKAAAHACAWRFSSGDSEYSKIVRGIDWREWPGFQSRRVAAMGQVQRA